jgi:hypothetical protein
MNNKKYGKKTRNLLVLGVIFTAVQLIVILVVAGANPVKQASATPIVTGKISLLPCYDICGKVIYPLMSTSVKSSTIPIPLAAVSHSPVLI